MPLGLLTGLGAAICWGTLDLFSALATGSNASSSAADEPAPAELGVNTMMTILEEHLPRILQGEIVDRRTAESFAYLDVSGYNYMESRYLLNHELHPQRVIVGSETHPKRIAGNWQLVREHTHLIGDFTWTGWDYLGESGIGRVRYASDPPDAPGALMAPYPWITANTGDVDITGFRRPVSYWREIVWGLRALGPMGFLKEMFAPKGSTTGALKVLMIVVFFAAGLLELISILFRPVSLSFRLYGNVFAGETMLETMAQVPYIAWLVQIPFYFLELLVGLVQALVFMLLTAVFTLLICQHHEEGSTAAHH